MARQIRSRRGLLNFYSNRSQSVRAHFSHLASLVENYPLDVALGYMFARLELGQNMALYCGVVKLHRAHTTIAQSAINSQHLTRKSFVSLYKIVFDATLPAQAVSDLRTAEKTRDAIMHGGRASEDRMRNAIAHVLDFAEAANRQLDRKHGIAPFSGYWRGFAGRLKKLDERTTRFMLKGMGFGVS